MPWACLDNILFFTEIIRTGMWEFFTDARAWGGWGITHTPVSEKRRKKYVCTPTPAHTQIRRHATLACWC